MSDHREVRLDPTTGMRVVLAPERLARPRGGGLTDLPDVAAANCAFCPGHESSTGHTVGEVRGADGWLARAFPNRFPALRVEADPAGAHEVIVEVPEHEQQLWQGRPERLEPGLRLARDRMRDLSGDARFRHFAWFRNVGLRAGSSQPHPHAQLVALPYVPALMARMVERARGGRFAAVIDHARRDDRVVCEIGGIVAICPWAPRFPFEVWLLPVDGGWDYRAVEGDALRDLATAMHHVLAGQAAQLPPLACCSALFTSNSEAPGFSWHFRIQPRPEVESGFAAATGDAINGVPPELAARLLR